MCNRCAEASWLIDCQLAGSANRVERLIVYQEPGASHRQKRPY